MADRYLYFILPGLIGGTLLAGQAFVEPLRLRLAPSLSRATLDKGLIGASVLVILLFAVRVHERAFVWRTGYSMMADAEAHYPQGMAAQTRIERNTLQGLPYTMLPEKLVTCLFIQSFIPTDMSITVMGPGHLLKLVKHHRLLRMKTSWTGSKDI